MQSFCSIFLPKQVRLPLCRSASPELLQINGSNSAGRVLLGCLLERADTGLDLIQLSGRAGALLTPFAHIIPVWLIRTYAGWKWAKGILPVLLIAGVSFPFLSSWYQGFTIPGWTGLVSLIPASFAVRGNTGLPKKAQ